MNERENFLRLIRFQPAERIVSGIPAYGIHYYGANHEGFAGGGDDMPAGSHWQDIWGAGWYKELPDVMGLPRDCPLADPAHLSAYPWPDPDDPRICRQIYERWEKRPDNGALIAGSHRDTLWERAYMLAGMENMMEWFYTEPELAREILHRIMDFQLGIARHYLKCGLELADLGDDLGAQTSLLLSPAIIQEFLVPEYRRLIALYKQHGVIINFHSCGHIEPLLDLFLDLGVDILNPIQVTANDIQAIRRKTRGRMALMGGVSSTLIMSGTPQEIEKATRQALYDLGRDGGYICQPDQYMPYPPENLSAVYQTVARCGAYPLQPPD